MISQPVQISEDPLKFQDTEIKKNEPESSSSINYKKIFASNYSSFEKSEAFSDSIISQYNSEIDQLDFRIKDLSKQSIDHEYIKSIVQRESQYLKFNSINIQDARIFVLEKLMEIFILELTSRSLSNISDSSGWELNRNHVIDALKNTEYYDLFLNHINDAT